MMTADYIYLFLNPTIPIFEVVQNALVIAQVIIILAEVVSLMIRLVTIQFAAVSQPEAVAACTKMIKMKLNVNLSPESK